MFVSGVAQDKNMLGMTCLVVGLATIWRLLSIYQDSHGGKGRAKGFAAHGLLFLMIVWLLWQANSMTSISCLAMAGGLIAATTLFKFARKPSNIHVLLAAVVLTSSSVLFFNVGGGALQSMGRDPTLTGRTEIWGHLISLNRNPLLGAGYESFWLGENLEKIWKMADVLNGLNETHNAYLEIYLSLGWIGVILLAAMLVLGYRNVMAVLNTDPTFGNLAVGIFAAAIVYGFTESAAFKMMSPVWICFLIAILLPRTAQKRVSAEMQVLRPSRQREWFDPIGSIPTGS